MAHTSILIAHDGSKHADAVLDALDPIMGPGTAVTLLFVADGRSQGEALDAAIARMSEAGAEVQRRDEYAPDAAEAIVNVARELEPDLVAMSTHGRSGVERWVRGSVAERVLRECPRPVFMVNPVTHPAQRFDAILVPLDTTETSAAVLDTLIPLALAFGAKLTLLYVDFDEPADTPKQAEGRRLERQAFVEGWLETPRARAEAAGLEVELRVAQGDVTEQILALADPENFDLLVMSTHGRAGPSRWMLGSVAEKVLRECRLPVLVRRVP